MTTIDYRGSLRDFLQDTKEFAFDFTSCAARTTVAWRIMVLMRVGNDVAFSTALLLGGVRVFDKSTNWMRRTRERLRKAGEYVRKFPLDDLGRGCIYVRHHPMEETPKVKGQP